MPYWLEEIGRTQPLFLWSNSHDLMSQNLMASQRHPSNKALSRLCIGAGNLKPINDVRIVVLTADDKRAKMANEGLSFGFGIVVVKPVMARFLASKNGV